MNRNRVILDRCHVHRYGSRTGLLPVRKSSSSSGFSAKGVPAIVLTAVKVSFFGYAIMEAGRKMNARPHLPVIREISGRFISPLLDLVTTFFLLGSIRQW